MADFFADNMVKQIIGEIIEGKDDIKDNYAIWRNLTKGMIREFGVIKIIDDIEELVVELADADWFENKYPPGIFKEKKEIRRYKTDNRIRDLINTKLKITDLAKKYGLDTDKKGKTTCPFHFDSEPSLFLDDKKNVFHCFGCGAKGDIIKFYAELKKLKSSNGNM